MFRIVLAIRAVPVAPSDAIITSGRPESGLRLPPLRRLCSCRRPTQARTIAIPPSLPSPPEIKDCRSILPRGNAMGRTITHARKALTPTAFHLPTTSRSVQHVLNQNYLPRIMINWPFSSEFVFTPQNQPDVAGNMAFVVPILHSL
jgi:hypothetical protein